MRYKRLEIGVVLRYMACIIMPLYRENVKQIPGAIATDNNRSKFDITNKLYLSIGILYKYYYVVLYILLFSEICPRTYEDAPESTQIAIVCLYCLCA